MKYFANSYRNKSERILVTAIGSFSAEHVITVLKEASHFVAGCDIYPNDWVANSRLADHFRRAPLCADEENYLSFIKKYCADFEIGYIIPLIDPEVDLLSRHAEEFRSAGVTVCAPSASSVAAMRNKFTFEKIASEVTGEFDDIFTIRTELLKNAPEDFPLPAVIKPVRGRSSIGKRVVKDARELKMLKKSPDFDEYLIQPFIEGQVVTVDAVRDFSGNTLCCSRRELLRTTSGAGITVETIPDCPAEAFCASLLEKFGCTGCVNIEFIETVGPGQKISYHVLEINPRFSGGIEFSTLCGRDFVTSAFEIFRAYANGGVFELTEKIAPCEHKIIARSYKAYVME